MTKPFPYSHREAFALMWYACDCGHRERAWNSRDGVTPFVIGCPSCGGDAKHVDWNRDYCKPDHKPHRGQMVFRDGTPDEAREIMRRRLTQYRHAFPISDADAQRLIDDAGKASARPYEPDSEMPPDEFQQGWPMSDRHDTAPAPGNPEQPRAESPRFA